LTAPPLPYTRQLARVVRVQATTVFVTFEAWCQGQILVAVPLAGLRRSIGLEDWALRGAVLSAEVRLDAVLDTDLAPRNWRVVNRAGQGLPTAAQLLTGLPKGA